MPSSFLNHYAVPHLTEREERIKDEFQVSDADIWVDDNFINRDMESYQLKSSYISQIILGKSDGLWHIKFKVIFGASGCINRGKINSQGVPELSLMGKMSCKDKGLGKNSTKLTDHVVQVLGANRGRRSQWPRITRRSQDQRRHLTELGEWGHMQGRRTGTWNVRGRAVVGWWRDLMTTVATVVITGQCPLDGPPTWTFKSLTKE